MTKEKQILFFIVTLLFISSVIYLSINTINVFLLIATIFIPVILIIVYKIIKNPIFGVWILMIYGFIIGAAAKMTDFPAGTMIDLLVFLIFVATLLQKNVDWNRLKNVTLLIITIWFIYTVIEIINPLAPTYIAWFYAVRTMSVQIFLITIISLLIFEQKFFNTFIKIWFIFSILATIDAFRQKFMFPKLYWFEKEWLALGYYKQHILFGHLRPFSFYTDTGQFGAAEAHTLTTSLILLLNEKRKKYIIFFLITVIFSFLGMIISGTRGALFIPATGLFAYLIISKSWKTIIVGLSFLSIIYYLLAFTYVGHNIYEIRRMRTAVHLTEDPSFQVRLQNQKILKSYMADKPFGAGIGTSEYWGKKFSPNTFLANIATDSLYVKIWVETGIIGLFIWLVLILWIIFRGAYLINKIKDKQYKIQLISLWAGLIGIFVANYGNSVMTQFPTLVISYLSIGYIFRVEKDLKN